MTMFSIATPVPTRQSVLSTLGLWASTGTMTREPITQTDQRFAESDVLWSIELRPGFSEIDDPEAHRHVPQHAYLPGRDDVAVCGRRPAPRILGARPARLGLPSPSHDLQCAACRRLVRPTGHAIDPAPAPGIALMAPIALVARVEAVAVVSREDHEDDFERAEMAASSGAAIDVIHPRRPVGLAAWRISVAERPLRVAIREDLLMAPDYRSARTTKLPPKLGRCEFASARARCTKPGRWHRQGHLTCRVHAAARTPRAWGTAAAA